MCVCVYVCVCVSSQRPSSIGIASIDSPRIGYGNALPLARIAIRATRRRLAAGFSHGSGNECV